MWRILFSFVAIAFFFSRLNAQESFDRFVDQLAADWMRSDPVSATSSQFFSGAEQDELDRRLIAKDFQYGTPLDSDARARRSQAARDALNQLRRYSPAELDSIQRVSRSILEWKLRDVLRTSDLADHRFVFEQFRGLQIGLVNFLSQVHPVRNGRDVQNYLARLQQLAPLLRKGVAEAKRRADHGILPPKFILKSTLDGIERFSAPEPEKNVLVVSLAERTAKLESVSPEERAASLSAAEKIVREAVLPAFHDIRDLLSEEMETASNDAGLWRLPRGPEAYSAALATNTSTELTPDQIHELGLKEVARIESEMDKILRELGYTAGLVQERYDKLQASLQPPENIDPRASLLIEYTRIVQEAELRATNLFDLRPKAPIQVVREPSFTEKTAAAHYSAPAPDGTRPGTFWVPLPGPNFNILGMRTLAYHEGVPGHHFQIALQQELSVIPPFRQKRVFGGFSAFAEGWALYVERLTAESGWYEGDPKGRLGQLASELFRARRLVVDTGLHAKHWTRQQAIDYGISAAEVERYVVMPGQACAYKMGELQILGLREKAQKALGPKFSLKEFHNVVLRTGEVPLAVLTEVIDDYISLVGKTDS